MRIRTPAADPKCRQIGQDLSGTPVDLVLDRARTTDGQVGSFREVLPH